MKTLLFLEAGWTVHTFRTSHTPELTQKNFVFENNAAPERTNNNRYMKDNESTSVAEENSRR